MQKKDSTSVLASYAMLKSLADEKKYQSPYQILREFIRYIINIDSLYTFSAVEMKNRLNEHFGFSIPEAVIKTSAKSMDGVSLGHGIYTVSFSEIEYNSLFEEKKKEADENKSYIIQLLSEYILSRTDDTTVNEEKLVNGLACFLTEDQSSYSSAYTELIGEFILKNENDQNIQQRLDVIREGSILYMGLSHNIGEIGSIKKPLALYLGTEILFSFAGFNGEIYQQFANDFFEQVRLANSGGSKKITLYYFSEIKKEIDEYFGSACEIVDKNKSCLLDKAAMKTITNGCNTSADVEVKKSDFYHKLKYCYGITEDPHCSYYDEIYYSTNLESFEYDDEADKKRKKEIALKLISHINKLRNGNRYNSEIDSEHIIVTNTKVTLQVSKEQVDDIEAKEGLENLCAFAVSLDKITSLLWYKLGNGFSKKTFPSSVSAILKARAVLSSSIVKNAQKVFFEVKQQFEAGELTEDQVAARIITLRNKPTLPEDLQGDDIDEIMDFSPEYLSRYEEQVKKTQTLLEEKEVVIESLKADTEQKISEKDATIALQKETIRGKSNENDELRSKLEEYQRKEIAIIKKKEHRQNISKFVWSILRKFIFVIFLSAVIIYVEFKLEWRILSVILTVADIIAFIGFVVKVIKNDYKKFFPKEKETE